MNVAKVRGGPAHIAHLSQPVREPEEGMVTDRRGKIRACKEGFPLGDDALSLAREGSGRRPPEARVRFKGIVLGERGKRLQLGGSLLGAPGLQGEPAER